MKYPRLLALAVLSLSILSCDNANTTQTAVEAPAETPPPGKALPPQTFVVSGQDITFFSGRGHLRMPDGWQRARKSGELMKLEAQRYLSDPDRWAMCDMVETTALNFVGVSQEAVNRYIEVLWSDIAQELEAEGRAVEVTYPKIGSSYVAKMLGYTEGEVEFIMLALFVIDGALLHGVHIACDTAAPTTQEDRADIFAFVNSFRYDHR